MADIIHFPPERLFRSLNLDGPLTEREIEEARILCSMAQSAFERIEDLIRRVQATRLV